MQPPPQPPADEWVRVVRDRVAGALLLPEDRDDPALHIHLLRLHRGLMADQPLGWPAEREAAVEDLRVLYEASRASGQRDALARAFGALAEDPDAGIRRAVAAFCAAFPDHPEAERALRVILSDGSIERGGVDAAAEVLGGLGYALAGGDAQALGALRASLWRDSLRVAAVPGLAKHDPAVLIEQFAAFADDAASTAVALAAVGSSTAPSIAWLCPLPAFVGRLARHGADLRPVLEAAELRPVVRRALLEIAGSPEDVGDHDDGVLPAAAPLVGVHRAALLPRGASVRILDRLLRDDPGFLLRRLPDLVRGSPGAVASLLALVPATGGDLVGSVRRIAGTGVISRAKFQRVAVCVLRSDQSPLALAAWPANVPGVA
jgi:hypothetical protein